MEQIINTTKRKIICFFILGFFVAFGGGLFSWQSVKNMILFRVYAEVKKDVNKLSVESEEFSLKVNKAKKIGSLLTNIRYGNSSTLRETLFRELEGISLFVNDITLKEREDLTGIKNGVIEVSVSGTILMENLPSFLEALSSRPKIWGVESLDITPKISPAELIGQFLELHNRGDKAGVEKLLVQGESLLQDEKSSLAEIKLKVLVVVG